MSRSSWTASAVSWTAEHRKALQAAWPESFSPSTRQVRESPRATPAKKLGAFFRRFSDGDVNMALRAIQPTPRRTRSFRGSPGSLLQGVWIMNTCVACVKIAGREMAPEQFTAYLDQKIADRLHRLEQNAIYRLFFSP